MEQAKKAGRPMTTRDPWGKLYVAIGGQDKLAVHLGVAKSTVAKWATGVHRTPAMVKKEILRLCEQFGITKGIEELLSPSSKNPPTELT